MFAPHVVRVVVNLGALFLSELVALLCFCAPLLLKVGSLIDALDGKFIEPGGLVI